MNVAFIPVRGGSKSIPLKNIRPMCGKPLVYWTVKAAAECKEIDKVYVSTDSGIIRSTVEDFKTSDTTGMFSKVEVIDRSAESASDTASTEFVMLEFAEKYDFDNIVLIQATSPLLRGSDLDRGFEIYQQEDTDSVLSVVRQKRFCWATDAEGLVSPTNYDVFNRPRRQEFDGYLVENGAFYISSKTRLVETKNRISGRIKACEMCEESFFEIDEPSDWIVIEALMKKINKEEGQKPNIKMFLTDVDGCLTDAGMYYSENGDELKKFNTKDGMGFKLLREKGIITGIITGENRALNQRRAEKLKLDEIHQGCSDKLSVVKSLCEKYGVTLEEIAYVGDDINDLEVIKAVGYSCAPKDAHYKVKQAAKYITSAKGGEGVIREVVDSLLNDGE